MLASAIKNVACTTGEDGTMATLTIREPQVDTFNFTSASKNFTEAN